MNKVWRYGRKKKGGGHHHKAPLQPAAQVHAPDLGSQTPPENILWSSVSFKYLGQDIFHETWPPITRILWGNGCDQSYNSHLHFSLSEDKN